MKKITNKSNSGKTSRKSLEQIARNMRRLTIEMAAKAGTGHIASGFSICEILTALYFHALRGDLSKQDCRKRDCFMLSKGHGAISLYAALYLKGLIPKALIDSYMKNGSRMTAFPTPKYLPGIDFSSGSLGHGLSVACGMALGKKRDKLPSRIFTVLSEGDCQEGSTWEAALFAGFHKLDNLTVIIDHNKLQAFGATCDILDLKPFEDKWNSFNFSVCEVDGHDVKAICRVLERQPLETGKPSVIIAHTVKGKGVSFMENLLEWHYLPVTGRHIDLALKEIAGE